jgi:hypothetical protein
VDGTRLAAGTTGLGLVFAVAWAAGALTAPAPPAPPPPVAAGPAAPAAVAPVGEGLSATAAGWTLLPLTDRFVPGVPGEFVFALTGPGAAPAAVELAVVRRDGVGTGRASAVAGPDGLWRAPVLLTPGAHRVHAVLTPPGGPPIVLGVDVSAPGEYLPASTEPVRVARAGPYQVRLDGDPVAGTASPLFATVTRDGAPVTDLEPDAGAFGRLTAVRRSDLARTDVPADAVAGDPAARAGPGIAFTATLAVPGPHALFLRFRHAGAVHDVGFALDVR